MNFASLCSLAGRYDKTIPTWCLALIDFLKIPAQYNIYIDVPLLYSGSMYSGHNVLAYLLLDVEHEK